MTLYEWCRVLINAGQLIAMIVIPFIVLKKKINLTYSDNKDEDEQEKKENNK